MGSREQAQAWPHFTSKIKRFPLVLKEKREIRRGPYQPATRRVITPRGYHSI